MTSIDSVYFTPDQIKFYQANGYIVVKSLFSTDEVKLLSHYVDEIENNWPEVAGKYMKYYEADSNSSLINRIENFLPYHPQMASLVHQANVVTRLSELLGDAPALFKDKINFKKPGGSDFKAHQDVQAGWLNYAQDFLSLAIALDHSTIASGCLQVGVGNYRAELFSKEFEQMTEQELTGFTFEYVEQQPGDVVFFDGFVPHKSDHNQTQNPRRNIYLTYNPISQGIHSFNYYKDKRASFPPDFGRNGKEYSYKI